MTRILCTGDWHVGSGRQYGHGDYGEGSRLADQCDAIRRIGEIAYDERVDLILFAGDLTHDRRPSKEIITALQDALGTYPHSVPIHAIPGNHDITHPDRPSVLDIFRDLLTVRSKPGVDVLLPSLSLAYLPWTPPSWLAATSDAPREELHSAAADHLVNVARALADPQATGRILLGHWAVTGAWLPAGLPVEAKLREPILDGHALARAGFDAIVLGHIHQRQNLAPDLGIPFFYVGPPYPIDFGDAEGPHGVTILDTRPGLPGIAFEADFVPVESRPFVTLRCDLDPEFDEISVRDALFAEATSLGAPGAVVRFRYSATDEQARHIDHLQIEEWLYPTWKVHEIKRVDVPVFARAREETATEDLEPLDAAYLWCKQNGVEEPDRTRVGAKIAGYLQTDPEGGGK